MNKNRYGIFIRIDIEAESASKAIELTEKVLETVSKPEGYKRWEHYQVEEV